MRIDPATDRAMIARLRSQGLGGPWLPLLAQLLALAGKSAQIVRHGERPWSSITFSGSRHCIVLAFTGEAAMDAGDDFIATLPDHEFILPRHIVADATVSSVMQETIPQPKMTVECELLLLDDL